MSIFGVDLATPVTNPGAMKAAGVHFVCRYVSTPGNAKNLTKAEADALKAAGLDIVVVFETTADRALSGHAGGVADAHSARTQAHACGQPAGRPVYFAVDFDAAGQTTHVNAYLAGVASVLGKTGTGVYGGLAAVKAALDAKVCTYAWQTYAWSGGVWDKRAQLQQYENGQTLAGHSVDYDRAMTTDYGQWHLLRRLVGYTVAYVDAHDKKQTAQTKHPARWLLTHPRAKKRGRVTVSRRFTT
jgi:hypothetical protein